MSKDHLQVERILQYNNIDLLKIAKIERSKRETINESVLEAMSK